MQISHHHLVGVVRIGVVRWCGEGVVWCMGNEQFISGQSPSGAKRGPPSARGCNPRGRTQTHMGHTSARETIQNWLLTAKISSSRPLHDLERYLSQHQEPISSLRQTVGKHQCGHISEHHSTYIEGFLWYHELSLCRRNGFSGHVGQPPTAPPLCMRRQKRSQVTHDAVFDDLIGKPIYAWS